MLFRFSVLLGFKKEDFSLSEIQMSVISLVNVINIHFIGFSSLAYKSNCLLIRLLTIATWNLDACLIERKYQSHVVICNHFCCLT